MMPFASDYRVLLMYVQYRVDLKKKKKRRAFKNIGNIRNKNVPQKKVTFVLTLSHPLSLFFLFFFVTPKALMNQHAAMQQLAKARFQVAQHLAVLSKDTVLFETTGQTSGADRSSDSVTSYFSIQESVANKTKMYSDKYKQFVVDYAQEWYKTITERVGTDLKKAEKIRVELDHVRILFF